MKRAMLGIVLGAWTLSAVAQVQVVESQPTSREELYPKPSPQVQDRSGLYPRPAGQQQGQPVAGSIPITGNGAGASPAGELFNQLQTMQEELMTLRGMVEEHEQTIRQLKQQRLDDYMSLDRRIAELGQGGGTQSATTTTTPATSNSATSGQQVRPATEEEDASYRAAYGLVKARRFDEATQAFERFVGRYPDGELTPNALYWLGELYLLEGKNDAARTQFETLLAKYGDNRKAADAMFKLAKVYHLEGRGDEARKLLDRVIAEQPGSAAAKLAAEYRQQNF